MKQEPDKGCFAPKGPQQASTGQRPVGTYRFLDGSPEGAEQIPAHK
jgi:hypothetical protein